MSRSVLLALAALLAAVFLAAASHQAARQGTWPAALDRDTLVLAGALRLPFPGPGDAPRLLSAIFLHVDAQHLAGNLLLLLLCGAISPVAPGSGPAQRSTARGLGLFLVGGIGGSLADVACYRDTPTLIVGASGALAAILAAILVRPGPRRARLAAGVGLGGLLLSGLVWHGDHAAHLGGMVTGLLGGALSSRRQRSAAA